jgi:N-acetylglucosaminyldiphosphoundecaprenol N-acetyl-beta-D-mannosaminyltransferase
VITMRYGQLVGEFFNKHITTDQEFLNLALERKLGRTQTVNLHHVALLRKNAGFRAAFYAANHLTADGWPVVLTLKLAGIRAQRVTGADFVEHLVRNVRTRGLKVGLLGASESAGDAFTTLLTNHASELAFREHGQRNDWQIETLSARIAAHELDVLLIAVSPPWGDILASEIAERNGGSCIVAVGGAIDMVVGNKRRAPNFIAKVGLEWLFRASQDPRHLFRRYVVDCGGTFAIYLLPLWLRLIASRTFRSFPIGREIQSNASKEQLR